LVLGHWGRLLLLLVWLLLGCWCLLLVLLLGRLFLDRHHVILIILL
jgi:hypothetical protein